MTTFGGRKCLEQLPPVLYPGAVNTLARHTAGPVGHYDPQTGRPLVPQPAAMSPQDWQRWQWYENQKKSVAVGYLLLIFFGCWGAHRFYLGRTGSAVTMLVITAASFVLMFVLIGFLTIFITTIWAFIDLFLIPSIAREENNRLLARMNGGY